MLSVSDSLLDVLAPSYIENDGSYNYVLTHFHPAFSFPKEICGTNSNFGHAFTFSWQKSFHGNKHFEDFHLLDLMTTSLTMQWQPVFYSTSSKILLMEDKLLLELHFNQNRETCFESLLKANYSKSSRMCKKKKGGGGGEEKKSSSFFLKENLCFVKTISTQAITVMTNNSTLQQPKILFLLVNAV